MRVRKNLRQIWEERVLCASVRRMSDECMGDMRRTVSDIIGRVVLLRAGDVKMVRVRGDVNVVVDGFCVPWYCFERREITGDEVLIHGGCL